MTKPDQTSNSFASIVGVVIALFMIHGGWDMIRDYLQSKRSYEKLASLHYHREWSVGEYRECSSMNVREEDEKPDVICADATFDAAKMFKIEFTGQPTYEPKVADGTVLEWLCRRGDADVSFSCVKKTQEKQPQTQPEPTPAVEHDLSKDDIQSLRKRNECEQRFYDKKVYQVNGMSAGEACKQNPDSKP